MSDPGRISTPDRYHSYVDFLRTHLDAWPQYRWLHNFLQHEPDISETIVTIFDTCGEELEMKQQIKENFTDITQFLVSGPKESEMRVIVVTYKESWACNRAVIDQLGLLYDVDPEFYRKHFSYYFMNLERFAPPDAVKDQYENSILLLPGEESTNQMHISFTREYSKLSAYIFTEQSSSNKTSMLALTREMQAAHTIAVLIWARHKDTENPIFDPPLGGSEAQFFPLIRPSTFGTPKDSRPLGHKSDLLPYVFALQHLSRLDIKAGQKDPFHFIFPYVRYIVLRFYDRFKSELAPTGVDFIRAVKSDSMLETFNDNLAQLQFNMASLRALQVEITRPSEFLRSHPFSSAYITLINDVKELQCQMEELIRYYQESKRDMMTTAQIEETRISTTLAITLSRLTKLAFVFIPLTFSATIFGMNLEEFGQGTASIRSVIITAAIVGAITLLPLIPSVFRVVTNPDLGYMLKILVALMLEWPMGGFWFLALWLRIGSQLVMSLCGSQLRRAYGIRYIGGSSPLLSEDKANKALERLIPKDQTRTFWKEKAQILNEHSTQAVARAYL